MSSNEDTAMTTAPIVPSSDCMLDYSAAPRSASGRPKPPARRIGRAQKRGTLEFMSNFLASMSTKSPEPQEEEEEEEKTEPVDTKPVGQNSRRGTMEFLKTSMRRLSMSARDVTIDDTNISKVKNVEVEDDSGTDHMLMDSSSLS